MVMSKEDAIKIIRKLEIPIKYNEGTALLSTANVKDIESLNLQEFINLIFFDNPQLDIDLKKIYNEEDLTCGVQTETKAGNLRS
jgi:hypothetical protein